MTPTSNAERIRQRLIDRTVMVGTDEAGELLALSKEANAAATLKQKAENGELLCFTVEGRPAYPLFQFDVENRRIYPVMARMIAAIPEYWSAYRLLYWLMLPHLDFEERPAMSLGDEETVLASFFREIEPPVHG